MGESHSKHCTDTEGARSWNEIRQHLASQPLTPEEKHAFQTVCDMVSRKYKMTLPVASHRHVGFSKATLPALVLVVDDSVGSFDEGKALLQRYTTRQITRSGGGKTIVLVYLPTRFADLLPRIERACPQPPPSTAVVALAGSAPLRDEFQLSNECKKISAKYGCCVSLDPNAKDHPRCTELLDWLAC
eukprot:TRINITY_DN58910_c0_g2_i1.p1 TRINITY_DN58910_c0_g2~~TRINITY_DN58910_c0_g2_i1.p1  ORF type:complete len:187 (-),score=5.01 TRINITY_DN58910_c0_g2_i1:105-665(-)